MNHTIELQVGIYILKYNKDTEEFTVLRNGEQYDHPTKSGVTFALFAELIKAKHSLFICPDCGYKVCFEEFMNQEIEDE